MREAEIQSLVALISGSGKVVLLLLLRHGLPLCLATAVDGHIQDLGADKEADVVAAERYQNSVASFVQWLIFCTVDLEQACQ